MPASVRILRLPMLLLVCSAHVIEACACAPEAGGGVADLPHPASPAVLSAVYETREVGMMSDSGNGELEHEQYHAALFTVTFDQPLFVNGSVPFDTLSPDPGDEKAQHHYLYGIARLECGGKLFETHPPLVPSRRDTQGAVPLFLVPLNEPHEHPAHRLFAVFKEKRRQPSPCIGSNRFAAVLFLDYTARGDTVTCVDPEQLAACVLAFPPETEQSWWPTARLSNVAGEPFVGRVNLTHVEAEDNEEQVGALARTASTLQARRAAEAARRAHGDGDSDGDGDGGGDGDGDGSGADGATSAQRQKNEVAVQVLLERARGQHFADSNSVVDTTHVYSLLEVMHRVGTLERVEANQYFELIEDPLLNLLVPMMVDILVGASKTPLIQALCKVLERIIPKILAAPAGKEMEMLQTGEGLGALAGALGRAASAAATSAPTPGLESVGGDLLRSDRPPASRRGSAEPAWATEGARAEDEVGAAVEDARRGFQELGVSMRTGSGCNTAETESQCREFSEHKSREKCTWCTRDDVNGKAGSCVACDDMTQLLDSGFKCSPTEEECKPSDAKPEEKKEPEALDDWGEPPTGTQLEEDIANTVVDGALTQIAHDAHMGLAGNLAKVVNGTVVRGASRALTQSLSVSLTQSLSITLTSAIAKILTRITTKEITMALTPSLTHALTPAISQALSHKPAVDYYCHYCEKSKMYCEQCHAAAVEDYYRDYYADYYAEYYSRYYAHWYGAIYADLFVSEELHHIEHSSNPGLGEAP